MVSRQAMKRDNSIMEFAVGEATVYALPLEGSGRAAERAAVARLFAEVLGSEVGHYADGAPYAVAREDVAVSVSHGAGMAVLAIAREPIGVDIESAERTGQLSRVASRFVGTDDDPSLTLLELWTAKEAVYKAVRRVGLPLAAIAVTKTDPVRADVPLYGRTESAEYGRAEAAGHTLTLRWHPLPHALLCLATLMLPD